jgi:hypothetical protein
MCRCRLSGSTVTAPNSEVGDKRVRPVLGELIDWLVGWLVAAQAIDLELPHRSHDPCLPDTKQEETCSHCDQFIDNTGVAMGKQAHRFPLFFGSLGTNRDLHWKSPSSSADLHVNWFVTLCSSCCTFHRLLFQWHVRFCRFWRLIFDYSSPRNPAATTLVKSRTLHRFHTIVASVPLSEYRCIWRASDCENFEKSQEISQAAWKVDACGSQMT